MDTGVGHADDAEVSLMLRVPGFKSATSAFVIEFEVQCKSFCTFIVEMVSSKLPSLQPIYSHSVILFINGSLMFDSMRHKIYRWLFEKRCVASILFLRYLIIIISASTNARKDDNLN